MFQKHSGQNIENPKLKGNYQCIENKQPSTLSCAGYNMLFGRDEIYLVSQKDESEYIFSDLKF